jgi:hypothetical protein
MRPWQHAKASARRGARDWQADLAIHELLDVTKASLPDLRHRMVLHNADLGPEIAARCFPDRPHAREVARAHAREDLGADVPVRVWIELLDPARLPRVRALDVDAIVEDERRRAHLRDHDGPSSVIELLRLPLSFAPDEPRRAWCFLAHAAGLGLVRQVLGPPVVLPGASGGEVVFDPAFCAEGVLHRLFRRIPELRELADALYPSHRLVLDELVSSGRVAS